MKHLPQAWLRSPPNLQGPARPMVSQRVSCELGPLPPRFASGLEPSFAPSFEGCSGGGLGPTLLALEAGQPPFQAPCHKMHSRLAFPATPACRSPLCTPGPSARGGMPRIPGAATDISQSAGLGGTLGIHAPGDPRGFPRPSYCASAQYDRPAPCCPGTAPSAPGCIARHSASCPHSVPPPQPPARRPLLRP